MPDLVFDITRVNGLQADGRLRWAAKNLDSPATSGPHGNGMIPTGMYTSYRRHLLDKPAGSPFCDVRSKCWMQPVQPNFSTTRTELGIHPDGNVAGTAGCIGLRDNDTAAWYQAFYGVSDKLSLEVRNTTDNRDTWLSDDNGFVNLPLSVSLPSDLLGSAQNDTDWPQEIRDTLHLALVEENNRNTNLQIRSGRIDFTQNLFVGVVPLGPVFRKTNSFPYFQTGRKMKGFEFTFSNDMTDDEARSKVKEFLECFTAVAFGPFAAGKVLGLAIGVLTWKIFLAWCAVAGIICAIVVSDDGTDGVTNEQLDAVCSIKCTTKDIF